MAKLSGEERDLVKKLLNTPNDIQIQEKHPHLWQRLLDNKFIIQNDVDEILFIKLRFYKSKYNVHSLTFSLLPTRNCNCRCVYCFEDADNGVMSDGDCTETIKFIKAQVDEINPSMLRINWYGGEPLLEPDIIYRLSEKVIEICKTSNIPYQATLITNGYLLTEEIAQKLKSLKVSSIQITLDGPENIHDQRRILKNGYPTFSKIRNNIRLAQGVFDRVDIRIHVDRVNRDSVFSLLSEDWLYSDNGTISPGYLRDYSPSSDDWSTKCKAVYASDFYNIQSIFNEAIENKSGKKKIVDIQSLVNSIPVRSRYCGADYMGNWVIGPGALVYKCVSALNKNDVCGYLKDARFHPNSTYAGWFLNSPFDNQRCEQCKLLPLCMGGCNVIRSRYPVIEESDICDYWSVYIREKLNDIIILSDKTVR